MHSNFDHLVSQLRAGHLARMQPLLSQCAELQRALDAYFGAAERTRAVEAAVRLGIAFDPPAGPAVADTAAEVRRLVDQLVPPNQETSPGSPDVAMATTHLPDAVCDHGMAASVQAVLDEVDCIDFDDLPAGERRIVLQLNVARVRLLKAQGADAEATDRIIRKLTAIAREFSVPRILGLKRSDDCDWRGEIERTEVCLARIGAGRTEHVAVRIEIPSEITERVEEQTRASPTEVLDAIKRATTDRALVIVGGIADPNKLAWVDRTYGLHAEWVVAQDCVRDVQALCARIARGSVAAVVVLEGLMAHSHYSAIKEAARRAKIPIAYANKGGTGGLRDALRKVDDELASWRGERQNS